jgi:CheY-like chemotaxis protein
VLKGLTQHRIDINMLDVAMSKMDGASQLR